MPSRDRVKAFIARVEQGRYVEAIREFYAPDASMQENLSPPRKGIEALVAGEERMLASVREARTLPVEWFMVEGDRSVVRWVFEFVRPDGSRYVMDEVACQLWRGEHIVEERFYYDPAQIRPAKTAT